MILTPKLAVPLTPGKPAATVVALAASAGGLNALTRVLAALPRDFPAAVVVLQHLAAGHASYLAEILRRRTPLRVKQAEEGDEPLRRHGLRRPARPPPPRRPGRPADAVADGARPLRATLRRRAVRVGGRRFGRRPVTVILSGAGFDGAAGAAAVRRAGGFSIVQDRPPPSSSACRPRPSAPGPPTSAGPRRHRPALVDRVPKAGRHEHPRRRRRLRRPARLPQAHPRLRLHRLQARQPGPPHPQADAGRRRRAASPTTSTTWKSTPRNSPLLFNTILINVTAFFRDPTAWEHLAAEVVPRADRGQATRRPDPGLERRLRLGRGGVHAGHGAGRGPGPEAFRERVKIYATDVDDEALTRPARRLHGPRAGRRPRRRCGRSTSSARRPLRLPQGPPPVGHLRPPRPDPGRPDLADRPARLPQHADVLQRRDPGARSSTASISR